MLILTFATKSNNKCYEEDTTFDPIGIDDSNP